MEQEFNNTEQAETSGNELSQGVSTQDIVDITSLQKFRVGESEMTPQELQNAMLRHSDYTRKTQELAEQRKQWDHYSKFLLDDLDAVKKTPSLATKFKEVYPREFHGYLDKVLKQTDQTGSQNKPALDPETQAKIDRVTQYMEQTEINAINKELDVKFSDLAKKYPYADEEACIARAQYLIDSKVKSGQVQNGQPVITDKEWDAIWKSQHDRVSGMFNKNQSNVYNNQRQANAKGRDVASGGGIPGQAPSKPKNISQASDAFLKHLMES